MYPVMPHDLAVMPSICGEIVGEGDDVMIRRIAVGVILVVMLLVMRACQGY